MSKKVRPVTASIKARNPLSLNPLMKKSHAHNKSAKAQRAKDKKALNKQLQQRDITDGE